MIDLPSAPTPVNFLHEKGALDFGSEAKRAQSVTSTGLL
jgi:hypothetical protein